MLSRWCSFANWCCCALRQEPGTKLRHGRDAESKRQQRRRKLVDQECEKGEWMHDKESTIQEVAEEPIRSKDTIQEPAVAEDTDPPATGCDTENRLPNSFVSSTEVQVMEARQVEPVIGNSIDCAKLQSKNGNSSMRLEETSFTAVDCFVDANEAWVRQAEARQADDIIVMQQEEQMLALEEHNIETSQESHREELTCPCDIKSDMPKEQELQLEELVSRSEVQRDKSEQQEEQEENPVVVLETHHDESNRQDMQLEELAPALETGKQMPEQPELQLEELAPALEIPHELPEQPELQHEEEPVFVLERHHDDSELQELQVKELAPALETGHEMPVQPELQLEESSKHVEYEMSSFAGKAKSDQQAHHQLKFDHGQQQQQQLQLQQQKQQERVGRVRELKRRIEARSQQQVSPAAVRASSPTTAFRFDAGAAAAAAAAAACAQRLEEAATALHGEPQNEVASFCESLV